MRRYGLAAVAVALALLVPAGRPAIACPFCAAVSKTFSEEFDSMDAVVVVTLTEVTRPPQADNPGTVTPEVPRARFRIEKVIKGGSLVRKGQAIQTLYYGDGKPGERFLLMGVDPPQMMWSTPLKLTPRSEQYLCQLPELPKSGPDRLAFFLQYLEDPEDILATDAYEEFARASYDDVRALRDRIDRTKVLQWAKDLDIPVSRKRAVLCAAERLRAPGGCPGPGGDDSF